VLKFDEACIQGITRQNEYAGAVLFEYVRFKKDPLATDSF